MSKGFRFLDDIALADLAFEAWADTPSELFVAASGALAESMANTQTIGMSWQKNIALSEASLSELLFEWLSYLVFLKDAECVVIRHVEADVRKDVTENTWHVQGTVVGDHIDIRHQELRADVKAITKHLYEVEEHPGQYRARVVVDV